MEGYVLDPMESVLDASLAAIELDDALRDSFCRGRTRDTVDCFRGYLFS